MSDRLKLWSGLVGLVLLTLMFLQVLSKPRLEIRSESRPESRPKSLAETASQIAQPVRPIIATRQPSVVVPAQLISTQAKNQAPQAPLALPPKAKDVVRACLSESSRRELTSETDFDATLDSLAAGLNRVGSPRVSLARRRIDIVTDKGETKRLVLLVKDAAQDGTEPKVQIFKTVSDDRPVAQALPASYRGLSANEIVERFQKEGRVESDQATNTFSWSANETAIVTTRDGHVQDLQFMFDERSLGCAHDHFVKQVDCSCY